MENQPTDDRVDVATDRLLAILTRIEAITNTTEL